MRSHGPSVFCWNLREFPAEDLAKQGITVLSPDDDYLCGLLDADPDPVMETLSLMARSKRRPPMTRSDLLERLAAAGARSFAEAAARHL